MRDDFIFDAYINYYNLHRRSLAACREKEMWMLDFIQADL